MAYLPGIDTLAEFEAFRLQSERWCPAVAAVLQEHGLSSDDLENLGGGNLIVGTQTHVIKLAPRTFAREIQAETTFLQHAPPDLPLSLPLLHASGEVDSWTYVIETRLPGETLGSRWEEVEMDDRVMILRAIGRWLAVLHHSEIRSHGVLADAWSDFLSKQLAACASRQSRWGVSSSIVDGIENYLDSAAVTGRTTTTMLHADLTDENVLLERDGSRWRISAVIDFGDARIGDPLYDLITPGLLIARGDRLLLEALLDGYGIEPSMRSAALRKTLMAYSILHSFNDLTRYTSWGNGSAHSIEELAEIMFPFR
jgi:hygromycin-B 7''-O-kinase